MPDLWDWFTGGSTVPIDDSHVAVPNDPHDPRNALGYGAHPVPKIVNDTQDSEIQKFADELGIKLTDETKDYLFNAYFNNWLSEKAFQRELDASSSQYQRTVADLRAAGLNPFLALQSLGGSSVSSSGGSVSGGSMTSRDTTKMSNKTDKQNAIARILAIIAAAAIYAMA